MPHFYVPTAKSRAGARPVIFDFFLHLFTNRTQLTIYHLLTYEGFTPFFPSPFLHPHLGPKIRVDVFLIALSDGDVSVNANRKSFLHP